MLIYLHNSRCSKSREGLKLMEKSGKKYVLREYLKNPLDYDDLLELSEKLGMEAIDFTRTNEKEFEGLSKENDSKTILKKMANFPKLMQRPIVYNDTKAYIGRPVEDLLKIL